MISSEIRSFALSISVCLVIEYFDLENPKYAFAFRVGYGVVQVLLLAALAYIRSCILKNKEKDSVTVVSSPKFFSDEEAKRKTVSIQDYDKHKLNNAFRYNVIHAAFTIGRHMWLKRPLILISILDIETLFTSNLFQIYILKRKAEGQLARPWKKTNLFTELLKMVKREKVEPVVEEEKSASIAELEEFEEIFVEEPETKITQEPLLRNRAHRVV